MLRCSQPAVPASLKLYVKKNSTQKEPEQQNCLQTLQDRGLWSMLKRPPGDAPS